MRVPENDEVDPSKWKQRNPSWYPDKVRKGRSEGLNRWINSILNSINGELTCNQGKLFNNLTVEQRNALKVLSNDKNIVIKPADKGGALVIMDKEDYEKACNAVLEDPEFYEEMKEDPNPGYQEKVKQAADELQDQGLINSFENETISKGSRSPLFYGLPKIHKVFNIFPALRPICSGSDGPTKYLSEFVDTHLNPLARKASSFVRDSSDFINKTKNVCIPKNAFLVTMDVVSLYPNIDQDEGITACEEALKSRAHGHFPSATIKIFKIFPSSERYSYGDSYGC